LYVLHLFEEDQVILTSKWRDQRVRINGPWKKLRVYRLGDVDLFLTKLMRNDPQDIADAKFVIGRANWSQDTIARIISSARVPDIPEIREQFVICTAHFVSSRRQVSEKVMLGSEAVATLRYHEKERALDIQFRSGDTYRYKYVPEFVYRELLKAKSAGKFWNTIKNLFAYEKLDSRSN
jgi:hypothetical protein